MWWYQPHWPKKGTSKTLKTESKSITLQPPPFQTCHQTSPYPYLQVHQTAVVDVVCLKGFPNALLPADARAGQNLLEVNRSTSAKKTGNNEETTLTRLWSAMHGPPLQGFNVFAENFNFGAMIRHWKWKMWGCCTNRLYHFDHWHFEPVAWRLFWGTAPQISGISSPHPKASKIESLIWYQKPSTHWINRW